MNCCVPGCFNHMKYQSHLKFYPFPGKHYERERKQRWIQAINRVNPDGSPWAPTPLSRVCSEHFVGGKSSNIEKDPAYVPTIFPLVLPPAPVSPTPSDPGPSQPSDSRRVEYILPDYSESERRARVWRAQRRSVRVYIKRQRPRPSPATTTTTTKKRCIINTGSPSTKETEVRSPPAAYPPMPKPLQEVTVKEEPEDEAETKPEPWLAALADHNYASWSGVKEEPEDQPPRPPIQFVSVSPPLTQLPDHTPQLQDPLGQEPVIEQMDLIQLQAFMEQYIVQEEPSQIQPRNRPFKSTIAKSRSAAARKRAVKDKAVIDRSVKRVLENPLDQLGVPQGSFGLVDRLADKLHVPLSKILIVLKKLKRNSAVEALASSFHVSVLKVNRALSRLLPKMAVELRSLVSFGQAELALAPFPRAQGVTYTNIVAALDLLQVSVASLTLKCLVACTPSGRISFTSDFYPSSTSDADLLLASGFLSRLTAGDQVVAAPHLTALRPVFEASGLALLTPPFPRIGPQYMSRLSGISHQVSSVVQKIRGFELFAPHVTLDSSAAHLLNPSIVVVSALVNLHHPHFSSKTWQPTSSK